jgi:hypothetical protein
MILDRIIIIDNVLTKKECDFLIDIYNKKGPTHRWQDFFPMNIPQDNKIIMHFVSKIIEKLQLSILCDWCEIVKFPTNSQMLPHKDFGNKNTVYSSVTYLNDSYTGGETYFTDGFVVSPKIGRTVFFNGQIYEHEVKKITSGDRFTLPIWYKNDKR